MRRPAPARLRLAGAARPCREPVPVPSDRAHTRPRPDAGTLADLDLSAGLPPAVVADVVAQLAGELSALHRAGASYGRLAPATIAVRSRSPLRVGLCGEREPAEDAVAAYRAPEPAGATADWWSLGVVVHHLVTGVVPFDGLDTGLIGHEIALRGFTADGVVDGRLRRLCDGLLQGEPGHRWGTGEVREWISGGEPPVFDPSREVARRPLVIAGVGCTTRREAARTIVRNWARACDELCGPGVEGRVGPWLEQFSADVDARARLIDQVLDRPELSADTRLLFLLRWLDRRQRPVFRGRPMSAPALAELAEDAARRPAGPEGRLVADLWLDRLLPLLADFAGGSELRAVHARWMRLTGQLRTGLLALRLSPRMAERLPELILWQRALLLGLAAAPDRGHAVCGEAAALRRDPGMGDLPPVTDPISAVVVMSVARLVREPVVPVARAGAARSVAVGHALAAVAAWTMAVTCLGPALLPRPSGVLVLAAAAVHLGWTVRRVVTAPGPQ